MAGHFLHGEDHGGAPSGAASAVLHALAAWGQQKEAHGLNLQLQVMHDNGPARRLYERVGFTPLDDDHYRELRPAAP